MFKLGFYFTFILSALAGNLSGQEAESKPDPRVEAVKSTVSSYVEAFNKKELEKVARLWARDCSYLDRSTGERVEGWEAMQADLKQAFAERPSLKLSGTVERVKIIADTVAQVEGETVMGSPDHESVRMQFTAILVQSGNRWQIHSLEESTLPSPESSFDALKPLDWMVGHWMDKGEVSSVQTNVRWSANGAFLLRSVSMQTEAGVAQESTQLIGWDPRAKHIRSWTFNSDGSFGEGLWSKSGSDWLNKSSQTLEDGRAASGTYVIEKVSDDAIRVRLIGHTIDGAPQPASEAVTMMRIPVPEEPANKTEVPLPIETPGKTEKKATDRQPKR